MDDHRPVESTQFSCSRFGKDTRINIYDMRKPNPDGRVLPANFVRVMQCRRIIAALPQNTSMAPLVMLGISAQRMTYFGKSLLLCINVPRPRWETRD
jgi:hypothetical protein